MKKRCVSCATGMHWECTRHQHDKAKDCDCVPQSDEGTVEFDFTGSSRGPTDSKKLRANIKDKHSTGRKRAARLYPIESGSSCEWRMQGNCGGGLRPIIGCIEGFASDRHHGPIKDTLHNELGNVHRICSDCHNHWHELNDLIYDETKYRLLPHDPHIETIEEVVAEHVKWKTGQMSREFELASSKNAEKGRLKLVD